MHIDEAQTVTAMRSQSVRNVRNNFMNMYKYRINCPVQCRDETPHLDTQNHMFHCKILNNSNPLKLTIDNVYVVSSSTQPEIALPITGLIMSLLIQPH